MSLSAKGNQNQILDEKSKMSKLQALSSCVTCSAQKCRINLLLHVYRNWHYLVLFGFWYWSFTQIKFPLFLQILVNCFWFTFKHFLNQANIYIAFCPLNFSKQTLISTLVKRWVCRRKIHLGFLQYEVMLIEGIGSPISYMEYIFKS